MALFTIGHSNRSLEELVGLLRASQVDLLVDVRRLPGSQRQPHFSRAALAAELPGRGIAYGHLEDLGGLRRARPDSPNTAWRNEAFRAYADHMATPAFRAALERLLELAEGRHVAVMCAEAVPWRCHRQLLADALTARGREVRDILGPAEPKPHRLPDFALVEDGAVTYPAPDTLPWDG